MPKVFNFNANNHEKDMTFFYVCLNVLNKTLIIIIIIIILAIIIVIIIIIIIIEILI